MRTVIQILLVVAAIVITYLIYTSVNDPIQFEKEKKARYETVVQQLKDIRKAQQAYKEAYGRYTSSFDTLINFVKFDSIPTLKRIGTLTDSMLELGWDEERAIKEGAIIRDTIFDNVLNTIFNEDYPIDNLRYVPVNDTVAEFNMAATIIKTGSGLNVPHAECKVHNNTYLIGLDRQLVINMNEKARKNAQYPGLKFGSLEEANNLSGNWE